MLRTSFIDRKIITTLLLLYVGFTLYNTLIPFRFHYNSKALSEFWQSFDWKQIIYQFHNGSKTDIVGNLLLFMPLGFLLYNWRQQNRLHMPVLYSVIAGFLFSTMIECLQLFFGGRISSPTDIINNTIGTCAGAWAGYVWLKYFASPVEKTASKLLHEQPVLFILLTFLFFQIIGAAFPFNVTITVSEILQGLKQANVIPFQNHSLGLFLLGQTMQFDGTPFNWLKFAETVLLWICWGYLVGLCYSFYWRDKSGGRWLAFGLCFFPGILMEVMQVFIASRYCNINDVIGNWIGTAIGVFFFYGLNPKFKSNQMPFTQLFTPIIGIYFGYILFAGLYPFDFKFSMSRVSSNFHLSSLIPFFAYFKNTKIWNIDDLIQSLIQFIPMGFFLSSMMGQKIKDWKILFLVSGIFGLIIGALIEFIQLFSPTRSADITDILLYGTGGWIGSYFFLCYKNRMPDNPMD